MNSEIFREYDIRGIADRDIPDETALLIGKAYGTIIHNNGDVCVAVGNDNRKSSPRILAKLKEGILSAGIDIIYVGEISTPLLYYAVHNLKVDGGISVTASHNPPEYNGFKIMVGKDAIFGKKIREIAQIAESKKFFVAKQKGKISEKSLDEKYLNEIASLVKIKRKLKVVIDAGNGMASELAPKLFEKLGLKPVCLFCEKDSSFPNHPPDPVVEENVKDLQKKVLETKADIGIAFDGDADRVGVVTNKGRLIFGDQLLSIFAEDVLKRKKKAKIIFEVKCSQSLPEWIEKKHGIPIMWKTGHSLIKAKMKEENAILAGEMSGHMFFAEKWYGFDDSLLAAAKMLEIASNSDKSVQEMVDELQKYFSSPEIRVECAESKKDFVVKKISEKYKKLYPKSITIDGIRIVFPEGWALVRKSNTQEKIILRFEAKTGKELERLIAQIKPEVEELILMAKN